MMQKRFRIQLTVGILAAAVVCLILCMHNSGDSMAPRAGILDPPEIGAAHSTFANLQNQVPSSLLNAKLKIEGLREKIKQNRRIVGLTGLLDPTALQNIDITEVQIENINQALRAACEQIKEFESKTLVATEVMVEGEAMVEIKCQPNNHAVDDVLQTLTKRFRTFCDDSTSNALVREVEKSSCFQKSDQSMLYVGEISGNCINLRISEEGAQQGQAFFSADKRTVEMTLPSWSEIKNSGHMTWEGDAIMSIPLNNESLLTDMMPRWGHIFSKIVDSHNKSAQNQ